MPSWPALWLTNLCDGCMGVLGGACRCGGEIHHLARGVQVGWNRPDPRVSALQLGREKYRERRTHAAHLQRKATLSWLRSHGTVSQMSEILTEGVPRVDTDAPTLSDIDQAIPYRRSNKTKLPPLLKTP